MEHTQAVHLQIVSDEIQSQMIRYTVIDLWINPFNADSAKVVYNAGFMQNMFWWRVLHAFIPSVTQGNFGTSMQMSIWPL